MMTQITVGSIARSSALTWLHEVQEHEELMRKSIAEWPEKTYHLAIHIQIAIDEAVRELAKHGGAI
jgi:hypothetical protein